MAQGTDNVESRGSSVRRWGVRAALLVVALLVGRSSLLTVETSERGVVERFGRPVRDVLPGIHLKLPWPIESVRRVAAPERSLPMPIGYRLIEEHLGIRPSPRQKEWLTGDNNIVELKANLLYGISDARQFLYGVSGVTDRDRDAVEPADFALRRIAEAALTELIGRTPVDTVLTAGSIDIAREARDRVQAEADALGLGVQIQELQILDIGPLATVERDFREVQDAKNRAATEITAARSSRDQLMSRARTRASNELQQANADYARVVSQAQAEADRFKSLLGVIGSLDSPAGRRYRFERLQAILKGVSIQVVPPGTKERPRRVLVD